MGTLYIDRKDICVRLDNNALAFYTQDKREGMVPIAPLKRVIIVGNVTLEASVLNRLADKNISVVFLSGRRMRFRGMLHGRLHNNGLLRIKQYEKSLSNGPIGQSFPLEFSLDLIMKKIKNQLDFLNEGLAHRPDLRFPLTSSIQTIDKINEKLLGIKNGLIGNLNKEPETLMETLRGYEGSAASAYFTGYTALFPESLNFKNRNRRPPEDPVNAMLSLCYTLLHYEMVREIETIGLDPTIGFYHQFEYGRESLACDMVELFRQDVDRFVWGIFRERHFTVRDFSKDRERPGCYLKKTGRERFYPLYEGWAKTKRPLFVHEVRALAKTILGNEYDAFIEQDTLSE
ncbi:MAG TPA: CRISPR-associated endonuclease Cas1 [Syntrophorhabdaceae bacterium]|nr:CRISPR-associated endonuclease Cas1 [Syntrophorhabdaceae bacterium]HPU30370.1 CRISPR-associated endonuclease Cas1 [Syntrophorhabdaceae bacterium]